MQRGDIILKIGDADVNSVSELRSQVANYNVGDTVKVTYDRNGSTRTTDLVLEEMPRDDG